MNINTAQTIQEDEYDYPYHYLVSAQPYFHQHAIDNWGINYLSTIEFILEKISVLRSKSIIDIGCGDGRLTRELVKRFPNTKVLGIDYSSKAIKLARALNPNIDYKKINIISGSIANKYDTAILMEVFEHIPISQQQKFIAGVAKTIGKNGSLYLTVPHTNVAVQPKHFQHFDSKSISDSLSDKFIIEQIIPFEVISWRKNIIDRLLSNQYFVLNYPPILIRIYEYYKKHLFHVTTENRAKRLLVIAKKK